MSEKTDPYEGKYRANFDDALNEARAADRKIEPALKPEEWADLSAGAWMAEVIPAVRDRDGDVDHAKAAILLHDQPFGFTWEQRGALVRLLDQWMPYLGLSAMDEDAALVAEIADRIAALLPPRE